MLERYTRVYKRFVKSRYIIQIFDWRNLKYGWVYLQRSLKCPFASSVVSSERGRRSFVDETK